MRELLDLFGDAPPDPMEAARRNMRPNLRQRFYKTAAVGQGTPYPILLDGRVVKTPASNTLAAPSALLAQAIATEWNAQGERINPATMPLTKLANTIIDGVAPSPEPVTLCRTTRPPPAARSGVPADRASHRPRVGESVDGLTLDCR